MKRALVTTLIFSGLCVTMPALRAGEPMSITPQDRIWMKQQQQALAEFKDSLKDQMINLPPAQQSLVPHYSDDVRRSQGADSGAHAFPAIYFVSLGIPEAGLLPMLDDARHFGVPATIRGWIDNDLRKTASRVFELTKKKKDIGVQIDPTLFQQYGITAVPALVVTCPGHFDVIKGSLPLHDMLQKVAEQGECQSVARELLEASR
ncbi:type-F conjugative transfer system pilin assembly protein TrbC [Scandinavium sp. NPDC088450]|uniref:type-F conjugative transfer system pilin assembly protein TrbC n=1 Tax=Scandinavium sp. NPDC088450 TaxID=3364514 RepID=UPI00384F95D3